MSRLDTTREARLIELSNEVIHWDWELAGITKQYKSCANHRETSAQKLKDEMLQQRVYEFDTPNWHIKLDPTDGIIHTKKLKRIKEDTPCITK